MPIEKSFYALAFQATHDPNCKGGSTTLEEGGVPLLWSTSTYVRHPPFSRCRPQPARFTVEPLCARLFAGGRAHGNS